jgi:Fe(3+) dicitrate transport protein
MKTGINTFRKLFFVPVIGVCTLLSATAQTLDSVKQLNEFTIREFSSMNGVGYKTGTRDGIIFEGKKNEVIIVDSLDANKAINNTRQILGRIPGLNIVETECGGFTANGIGVRGLNPSQSVEMNTRQNGYNISADVYGYNEAYYLPPMEAVSRIELIRGGAALQFGAQFGGMVNYILKDPSATKPIEVNASITGGSFGLFNSFTSVGGTIKKWSYYSYVQFRSIDGYRPNSNQWQLSGFGKVQYKPNEKFNVGLEYSFLQNQMRMPGGLSDSMFQANPQMSTRARNWLTSPWNIIAAYANFNPSKYTAITIKTNFLFSQRSLVWRNEDGGPEALDLIDTATNNYVPREVGLEDMKNTTTELRFSHSYALGKQRSVLAAGLRLAYAWFDRKGGGEGTTGSDFDLSITGNWGYNLQFTTLNAALFVENIFKIGSRLTITPGFRLEYLRSTAAGYKTTDTIVRNLNENRNRFIPLAGIGISFNTTKTTSLYGNFSQAYRPIDYGQLEPFGVTSQIDQNLKDSYGFNADLGFRGTVKNYFNFDISGFYMGYNDRIGVIVINDTVNSQVYSLRTNVANSVHMGVEAYVEFNFIKCFKPKSKLSLSIFDSFSYVDAKYTSGEFSGKRVEAAANYINRVGVNFNSPYFSAAVQVSSVGDAFGDASNVMLSSDPVAGYIPAYHLLDFSGSLKYKTYALKFGLNNITNQSYFTRRTDEYPGPGIIPSIGRSFYVGFSAKF